VGRARKGGSFERKAKTENRKQKKADEFRHAEHAYHATRGMPPTRLERCSLAGGGIPASAVELPWQCLDGSLWVGLLGFFRRLLGRNGLW
jgi:hypothetical protein